MALSYSVEEMGVKNGVRASPERAHHAHRYGMGRNQSTALAAAANEQTLRRFTLIGSYTNICAALRCA